MFTQESLKENFKVLEFLLFSPFFFLRSDIKLNDLLIV